MDIVSQIALEGEGRISFYAEDEQISGCIFHLPLKAIQLGDTLYPSNIHVDGVDFDQVAFDELKDMDGKEVPMTTPDDDDDYRHGSHYAIACHNPLDVIKMRFQIDEDHVNATVWLRIYYNVHGLSPVSDLSLDCRLRLTD